MYVKKIFMRVWENRAPSVWVPKLPLWFWFPVRASYALLRSLPPVDDSDGFPAAHDWVKKGDFKSFMVNVSLVIAFVILLAKLLSIFA